MNDPRRSGKHQKLDKSFQGCLGRMVNLFDLNTGIAANKMLTDKPYYDGSSLRRSQSDVVRTNSAPFVAQIDEKVGLSHFKRTTSEKKFTGTPIKKLVEQKMPLEVNSKHHSPNVVAKLMGLDTLPNQQPYTVAQRNNSKGALHHSGIPVEYWEPNCSFESEQMQLDSHLCNGLNEYTDIHETRQQSQKKTHAGYVSPKKGRHDGNRNEEKVNFVHQKFLEAKRLATDEKTRQSKEFQDALEFLSSNKDLFLKYLQEPNYLLSQHLYDIQSFPPSASTKRITVLKPSNMVDTEQISVTRKRSDKQSNKSARMNQDGFSPRFSAVQPTRIVVLKPSPGSAHATIPTSPSAPAVVHEDDFYEVSEDDDEKESREVAKTITSHMRENLMGHRRDETVLSSVLSNGYTGDYSSFSKSENEFVVENFSDSGVMSPVSRHSWDFPNRPDSPYSTSFSRASYSPESSVCREAKKRLSERWAMMASNEISEEQHHVYRSSNTLGEMLALSDSKKLVGSEEESENNNGFKPSSSILASNLNKEVVSDLPNNLLSRSQSVPAPLKAYEASTTQEPQVTKDSTKTKNSKMSLKGKVSSLFFSKSKKPSKGGTSVDESRSKTNEVKGSFSAKSSGSESECAGDGGFDGCFLPVLRGSLSKTSLGLDATQQKQSIVSWEARHSPAKPVITQVNATENQPSPVSVLDPPFDEDDNIVLQSSSAIKSDLLGFELPLKSNLIDKSPPIGSISRTLSCDNLYTTSSNAPHTKQPSSVTDQLPDSRFYVHTILSAAGLDNVTLSTSFLSTWYSPDCPLDPSLRNKYSNFKYNDRIPDWKLYFDCVNAALMELVSWSGSSFDLKRIRLFDYVLTYLKELPFYDFEDWNQNMKLEMDELSKVIQSRIFEELVEEVVVDLTSRTS